MKIIPNNLKRMYDLYAPEYEKKALEVLRSGWYILGREVENFEKEFASYMGAKHCVGLANGLDALWMSVHLWTSARETKSSSVPTPTSPV